MTVNKVCHPEHSEGSSSIDKQPDNYGAKDPSLSLRMTKGRFIYRTPL
jgi:hypothetical protein